MAVKSLYILRHGKSSWADPGQGDFDRPLNDRGTRSAERMGREAARRGWRPDVILCSPAARTTATLALFRHGWAAQSGTSLPDPRLDRAFYLADSTIWLRHLRALQRSTGAALLIGHNPGLHDLAITLAGTGKEQALADLRHGFPTCALAVIAFDASGWDAVVPGAGRLEALMLLKKLNKTAD